MEQPTPASGSPQPPDVSDGQAFTTSGQEARSFEWHLPVELHTGPELPLKSLGNASCPHGSLPLHAPWFEKHKELVTPREPNTRPVVLDDQAPVDRSSTASNPTNLTTFVHSRLSERQSIHSLEQVRTSGATPLTNSQHAHLGGRSKRRQTVAAPSHSRDKSSSRVDLSAILSPKMQGSYRQGRRSSNAETQRSSNVSMKVGAGALDRSSSNIFESRELSRSKSWPPYPHPRRENDLSSELEEVMSFQGFGSEDQTTSHQLSKSSGTMKSRDNMTHISTLSRRTLEVRKSIRHALSEADLQMRQKIEKDDQAASSSKHRFMNLFKGFGSFSFGGSALGRGLSFVTHARINFRQRYLNSTSSMASTTSSMSMELERFFGVITLSDQAVELFSSEGGPMSKCTFCLLQVSFFLLAATVAVLLSDIADLGFSVYLGLVRIEDYGLPLLASSGGLALLLHVTSCYDWKVSMRIKVVLCAFISLIFASGWLALTKSYPEIPLITAVLIFPLVMGLWRFCTSGRISSFSFHVATSLCSLLAGLATLITWIVWLGVDGSEWNSRTKQRLQASMSQIHREYDLENWEQCKKERLHDKDKELIRACSQVELLAFLVWVAPLAQSTALIALAIFLAMRAWFMLRSQRTENDDQSGAQFGTAQKIVFLVFILIGVFWIACSTAGASMGLSSTYLVGLGVLVALFCVWLFFTVRIEDLVRQMRGSLLWTMVSPWFKSDWARALAFSVSSVVVIILLTLEVVTRQFQRLCNVPADSKWMTNRGMKLLNRLDNWHWPSILEKSWICAFIFLLVWVVFSKLAIVFLSWFNWMMKDMSFWAVTALYYLVGLLMFMLPPITGIVVYMGAGVILVSRGMREPSVTFSMGVAYAAAVSLLLKMNAFVMQQKCIGEAMGHNAKIQQLVVVHNIGTVAMERILSRPGLHIDKVMVLCGGPDWPTAVISGILKLNVWQMLLGTLPCLFLIVPSVLAGACLLEESLAPIAPLTVILMGFLQGSVFVAALIFTAREATVHKRELRMARTKCLGEKDFGLTVRKIPSAIAPSIAKWERKRKRNTKEYLAFTVWGNLMVQERAALVFSVLLQLSSCWITTALSSLCFRPFSLAKTIGESYEEGGLNGNAFNLLLPLGNVACFLALSGIIIHSAYIGMIRLRQSLVKAAERRAAGIPADVSPYGSEQDPSDEEEPGAGQVPGTKLMRSPSGHTDRSAHSGPSFQSSFGQTTIVSMAGTSTTPKYQSEPAPSTSRSQTPRSDTSSVQDSIYIIDSTRDRHEVAGRPRVFFSHQTEPDQVHHKNPPREGRAGATRSLRDNPLVQKPGWQEPEPAPTIYSTAL